MMPLRDEGKTRFLDGMRVARVHLDHQQDALLSAAIHLRQSLGVGKVCYGLRVEALSPLRVKVGAGLAFDQRARPLIVGQDQEVAVDFGSGDVLHLLLVYRLRSEGLIGGIPTLLSNDVVIESRTAAPSSEDDGVIFAELKRTGEGIEVVQRGAWYLPPLDHGHSGQFLLDRGGRWRYDGPLIGSQEPGFDSGFVPVPADGTVRLVHGLNTANLRVEIQARSEDQTITVRGLGSEFWYELVGNQEVRLVRSEASTGRLDLRVAIWPLGVVGGGPVLPMADAGGDIVVESGASFILDGSGSRAFEQKQLAKYVWTQLF